MTPAAAAIRRGVTGRGAMLVEVSHRIHARPELAWQERFASRLLREVLADNGFEVTTGVAGLDTAFTARAGAGELVLTFCAEYDALAGIGHACGHNIIAASSLGAALVLADLAAQLGVTVQLIGTPAEESGGGKITLLEAGVFNDTDAAMMVHPGVVDLIEMPTLAVRHLDVAYTGRAAHASAYPERGISAADAMTVAQTAIGLARQYLSPTSRVHGVVLQAGEAPNVIAADARARYILRGADLAELSEVGRRIEDCFSAGAVATGCRLSITEPDPIYRELVTDPVLAEAYRAAAQEVGREARTASARAARAAGSTDMGNVSQQVAALHPMIGIGKEHGVPHQPQFAAGAVSAAGDRAVLDGATMLALTAATVAADPESRRQLQAHTAARRS